MSVRTGCARGSGALLVTRVHTVGRAVVRVVSRNRTYGRHLAVALVSRVRRMSLSGAGLRRTLGVGDAVVIGLGSMIGAGIFAALGPAAHAAGSGLLFGLALAAVVAYCNATSSARLAALYPSSGGTYVYGRERLRTFLGPLAGWTFVVGKTASCAAMALTFAAYAAPGLQRPAAVAAVLALTAVNVLGV